jgi:hypothetical protein
MPLHRNIHWIGRQWVVSGHGVQLIDQKLQGFFDIEISRLWDDALIESMHAKDWLNAPDFEKALALARTRFQQPRDGSAEPHQVVQPPVSEAVAPPVAQAKQPDPPKSSDPDPVEPPRAAVPPPTSAIAPPAARQPISPPTLFQMQYEGRAKFVRPWRVMSRKP